MPEHTFTLTDEEYQQLTLALACRLDDYKREIQKQARKGSDVSIAKRQWTILLRLAYRKIMPQSWCGPTDDSHMSFDGEQT